MTRKKCMLFILTCFVGSLIGHTTWARSRHNNGKRTLKGVLFGGALGTGIGGIFGGGTGALAGVLVGGGTGGIIAASTGDNDDDYYSDEFYEQSQRRKRRSHSCKTRKNKGRRHRREYSKYSTIENNKYCDESEDT